MKGSIYGASKAVSQKGLDPFFIELSLSVLVFAVCCCAVLQMLAISRERAVTEETKAAAVACAQSWCDIYRGCGNAELAAEELFGELPPECSNGSQFVIPVDIHCAYSPDNSRIHVIITEKAEDSGTGGIVCGQLYTSDIQIIWQGGEISASSACYKPFAAVVHTVTEEGVK